MVFSLEHDIKVTKSHQNLLPTQSVIVVHTVVHYCTSFIRRYMVAPAGLLRLQVGLKQWRR
jgi:hypothetical protein